MAPSSKGKGACRQWLLDHVNHDGPDCLIWPFSRVRGYGNFGHLGKQHYAHRYMCELVNGPPPSPKHQAAHSCGRGDEACVHPKHLSWKTQSENQLDRRQHGTAAQGQGWTPKISWQDVQQIRILAETTPHGKIAKKFGISRRNVGAILDGTSRRIEMQTEERERVVAVLKKATVPLAAADVVAAAGLRNRQSANNILAKLAKRGVVDRVWRGRYKLTTAVR